MELWARHAMARIYHQQDPVVCSEVNIETKEWVMWAVGKINVLF